MGFFGGGGGGTTSKLSRPDYINALIKNISQQEQGLQSGNYTDLKYQGLTPEQQGYLDQLMNNPELTGAANQLIDLGGQGVSNLDSYYKQVADVYNNQPTTEDINNLANQLYSSSNVQNEINAQNDLSAERYAQQQAPSIAETYMNQAGSGSGAKLAQSMAQRDLAREQQSNAEQVSSKAYNDALAQAQDMISAQQTNRRAALSQLGNNYSTQVGALSTGLGLSNQAQENALTAGQWQQQNNQAMLDTDYKNKQYAQNWGNMDIENRLGIASVLNAAQGQNKTVKTSGGGQGILGGALTGAIQGFMMGGPYGAMAGAAVGGAGAAASQ